MRRDFLRRISLVNNGNLFFLDECGFNRHTANKYGYPLINTKVVKYVNENRGVNVLLICMICCDGILVYKICKGGINSDI